MRYQNTTLHGVLVVDKPLGVSSMGVVRVVRRRAGQAKTGHAGTLDPLATGVLVCCLGRATKAVNVLMDTTKVYEATVDLSAFTNTDDAEGRPEPVHVDSPPTGDAVSAAVVEFEGVIQQTPPAFSAVKIGGERAYKLARTGRPAATAPRPVRIDRIEIVGYAWPELQLIVTCGKGTYIRALARDIGRRLGTGGHLTALRRTRVGPYAIDRAIPLDDVPDPLTAEHLLEIPRPEDLA